MNAARQEKLWLINVPFLLIKQNDRPLWSHHRLIWTRDGRDSGLSTATGKFGRKKWGSAFRRRRRRRRHRESYTHGHTNENRRMYIYTHTRRDIISQHYDIINTGFWHAVSSFLFDCISNFLFSRTQMFVSLSLLSFFFFSLFLNSTIKFEYWKSRITHLKFTEIFKKINTCLSKRQKEKFMIRAFVFWSRGEVFTRYDHKHVCRSKRLKMAGRKRRSVINHHLSLSEYNSEWDAEKPQTKGLRSPFKPRGGWIQPHRPAGPSHSQRNLKKCTKYDIIMATASPAKQSYHGRVFVCSFDFLHVAQKVPLLCRIFLHVLCFSLDARRRRRRN